MMKDIVGRKMSADGHVQRELSCGHWVEEGTGGKVRAAIRAQCDMCDLDEARQNLAQELENGIKALEDTKP